ncbi:MAG: type II toxin-antitoxin system RelE/ParE family toxin [Methylococcaceae bacterium]|nr:type II toxin-antitoxin system RelE/ParE family toxin [Methylococcaceae bacterium]
MYSITYRKSAAKALTKLPSEVSARFVAGFQKLASGETEGLDIKKLTGRAGFRLRIGGFRTLYRIEEEQLVIEVVAIGNRGDIYK